MQESVTYRAILQKGEIKGRMKEAQALLSLMVGDRFGEVSEPLKTQLTQLTLAQTEELARALHQLRRPADLTRWLKKYVTNGV